MQPIWKNEVTAKYRRVPILIYSDTDGVTPWTGSVTGVKAQLSYNGGAETPSTADIVRLAGAYHYVELTQAEANVDDGHIAARVAAAAGRLEGVGAAYITNYDPRAAGPTVGEVADGVLDEQLSGHTTIGSLGFRLQEIRSATAQGGAAGSITLDAAASAIDDFYKDALIVTVAGTGARQARTISTYTGATKVAAVTPNWGTTPDATTTFLIIPAGSVSGAAAPSVAQIADGVWDEARAGHNTAGTYGEGVPVISIPDAILTAAKFAANSINASALADDAATEIANKVLTTSLGAAYANHTVGDVFKIVLAVLASKASGLDTTTARFRNPADSADVVVATVDSNGNRSVVTRTP